MKLSLLLLLSFNAHSFFDDKGRVCLTHEHQEHRSLIDWWGATVEQIQKASCKTLKPPTEDGIDGLIKKIATGKTTEIVDGIQFTDESPVLVKAYKDLTKLRKPEASDRARKCDKVMCAVEAIWGTELSKKIMYAKLKHNFNASEFGFENADRFTIAEIDDVLIGLDDLPEHLIPLGRENQRLSRFKRGYILASDSETGAEPLANSTVLLFDGWSRGPSLERQYAIFHELSHNISTKHGLMDVSPDWLNLSNWIKKGNKWDNSQIKCIISEYGKSSPMEDFAESLSAYRYNPARLKEKCPEKFNFIKQRIFKGVDYTDPKSCAPVSAEVIAKAQSELTPEFKKIIGTMTVLDTEIQEPCREIFDFYPIHKDELTKCYLRAVVTKFIESPNAKTLGTLSRLGIGNSNANQEKMRRAIVKNLLSDESFISSMSAKVLEFQTTVENFLRKSFTAANAEGISKQKIPLNHYLWSNSLRKCGKSYFTASENEVIKCQIKQIVAEDKLYGETLFTEYHKPDIFSDRAREGLTKAREEALASHVYKQPIIQEVLKAQREVVRKNMTEHLRYVTTRLYKFDKWNKMSPENFCQVTYGSGSTWTEFLGVPSNSIVPRVYENCVREQSNKSRRFEFTESDIDKLMTP